MFNRNDYQKEYRKNKLKRISLEVPIVFFDQIKEHTEVTKESVNGFIKRAISETIENDKNNIDS